METDILPGDDEIAGIREGPRHGGLALPDLPLTATSFVGRDDEVGAVLDLIGQARARLVTLTGSGGIGKTRLAIEVARRCDDASGVAFVPLDATFRPDGIADTVVQRLGIEAALDETPMEAIRRAIDAAPLLLVLDNFEHLLPGAHIVRELLESCPRLTIMVTSRAPLGISGECVQPLEPLTVPASRQEQVADGAHAAAVRLFVDRARTAQPAFRPGAHNLGSVITIVRRLEGLPLAIELAAARMTLLSPHSLAERLDQRLALLTTRAGEGSTRQQTMRAAIAWSVDLLPDDVRTLWEVLGVFSGGFTIDAAEAVAAACAPSGRSVMDGVQELVHQSLLVARANANGEPRFAMLETTGEYALECLSERDAVVVARTAHARYFGTFARTVEPGLKGSDGWTWFRRVEPDLPNIRLALQWLQERGDIAAALEIASCLEWFWTAPGYLPEGRALFDALLPLAGHDVPARIRGRAAMAQGDLREWQGDTDGAAEAQRHALAAAREAGDQALVAQITRSLGSVMVDLGDLDEAATLLHEAHSLAGAAGESWTEAASANLLGLVSRLKGDLDRSRSWHETALTIWQHMGNRDHFPIALVNLGLAWLEGHQDQRAFETLDAALSFMTDDEDDYDTSMALDGFAVIAARHDQPDAAARLMGQAARQRRALGTPLRPVVRAALDELVAEVRSVLGDAAFAIAWAEGQAMRSVDAKRLAREVSLTEPAPLDGLSPREREVLSLLVEGASDSEIADRLFITRRTASKHVASILEKLDAGNRTAAATIAHRRGLV